MILRSGLLAHAPPARQSQRRRAGVQHVGPRGRLAGADSEARNQLNLRAFQLSTIDVRRSEGRR